MTDPINRINWVKEIAGNRSQGGQLKADKRKRHPDHEDDVEEHDSVEISEEARDRASGKKRKTIQEYMEE